MTPSRNDQSEELYVQVLENINDGVLALDPAGRISLFNPAAQTMTGISERQGLGKAFATLFREHQPLVQLVTRCQQQGRTVSDHDDIVLTPAPSQPLPVSATASPIYSRRGEQQGVVLILRDQSKGRELEEAIRQADRLSMMSTLAAGLAHEIKNPLGGIKGAAQLLGRELPAEGNLKEYIDVMVKEVERVNGIIEELMDLSRPRSARMGEVDLAGTLQEIVLFQRESVEDRRIGFQMLLDPSIPPIRGDQSLLTRLLLNLVKNAIEAIEDEGEILIATKVASELHLNRPGGRPVPFIQISIRDSGKGIPRETLDNIFTPFYTTKTRGTGLGLALCQKIVGEHQGFIKVESTPGEGTCFTVSLPFIRNAGTSGAAPN